MEINLIKNSVSGLLPVAALAGSAVVGNAVAQCTVIGGGGGYAITYEVVDYGSCTSGYCMYQQCSEPYYKYVQGCADDPGWMCGMS